MFKKIMLSTMLIASTGLFACKSRSDCKPGQLCVRTRGGSKKTCRTIYVG